MTRFRGRRQGASALAQLKHNAARRLLRSTHVKAACRVRTRLRCLDMTTLAMTPEEMDREIDLALAAPSLLAAWAIAALFAWL